MPSKLTTDKSIGETAAALQTAVAANHIDTKQVHNSRESMTKRGVTYAHERLTFEVCLPQQTKKLLVSTALRCRIALPEEGGKTMVATPTPSAPLEMPNAPHFKKVAKERGETITRIVYDTAIG